MEVEIQKYSSYLIGNDLITQDFILRFILGNVLSVKLALYKNNSAWLNYLSLILGVVIEKPRKINMFLI